MFVCRKFQRRSVVSVVHTMRIRLLVSAICGSLLCAQSLVASQQEYIDAIKADVDEFSSGEFNPPEGSTWVGSDLHAAGEIANQGKGQDLESFTEFLKEESPGSFIFFNKLPEDLKQKVADEYLEFGDLERTKKSILRYASSRKR
jgi:hypothetical protein